MMTLILEGIMLGCLLAVSLGPIFIALTQTSIEKGILPGLTVGSGIWISDFIFVYVFYNFIQILKETIESESFVLWMGLSGAVVLFVFGLVLLIKKTKLDYSQLHFSMKSYMGFWFKGFLINTINPFTFVFWMGVISTYVIARDISSTESLAFLGTILIIIILSDTGKVYLAHGLKKWLTPKHIEKVSNVSGVILMLFGCFLAYRVLI
ncbi:MAG: LysE family transporter [Saprospiraceae bacterium]|nr:LysE family transporter [Saprospiraceae bacterium]